MLKCKYELGVWVHSNFYIGVANPNGFKTFVVDDFGNLVDHQSILISIYLTNWLLFYISHNLY